MDKTCPAMLSIGASPCTQCGSPMIPKLGWPHDIQCSRCFAIRDARNECVRCGKPRESECHPGYYYSRFWNTILYSEECLCVSCFKADAERAEKLRGIREDPERCDWCGEVIGTCDCHTSRFRDPVMSEKVDKALMGMAKALS
jgi:hypothetical protein